MKNKSLNEHYQQILGNTSPWTVSEVRLDVEHLVNEVKLVLKPNTVWACPKCKARMHIKEWRTRRWRHLDSCQFKTVLEAEVPLVECAEHGAQTAQVPWAEGSSRFTLFFERFAIQVLEACPTSRASELLGISWDEADGIKQRAVRRGLARRLLDGLEYACVDEVRRREIVMGTVAEKTALKQTRQLWLWGEENLPDRHAARFEALKESTLKTARAWRLKELWRTFRRCLDVNDAYAFFHKWYVLAIRSKLDPVKKAARTFKAHLTGIVSIFKHGFCNALAEGVNSRIQLLIQKSCGYRNRERLKTDILFHFGGLSMDPLTVQ